MINHLDPFAARPVACPMLEPVELWLCRFEPALLAIAQRVCSPAEQGRASRFHFERDAHRYLVAQAFLRTVIARYCGLAAPTLSFIEAPHGKPMLQGASSWHFNLSHSADYLLVGITEQGPVGVDIELIQAHPGIDLAGVSRRIMSDAECRLFAGLAARDQSLAFFHAWTRKEAVLKALGTGFQEDARAVVAGMESGPVQIAVEHAQHGLRTYRVDSARRDSPDGDLVIAVSLPG